MRVFVARAHQLVSDNHDIVMLAYRPDSCLWCRAPLPPDPPGRVPHGHPRWYCNQACRQAAYRERRERRIALDRQYGSIELEGRVPATDAQVALTILEARSAAASFARLGRTVHRELAWRCIHAGLAITKAIDECFPLEESRPAH